MDLIKRLESTDCDMEVLFCKVTDAKNAMNSLVQGLHRATTESYVSAHRNADQLLVDESKRLKMLSNCKAIDLQWSALCVILRWCRTY